ncbi:Txe/YoeB family addiction module toxin [Mucilaginibacter psychrotolerans]|nr:Txe/YoeB family addiction module toxin [Mucilaginibacter psychrotolerans]
MEKISLLLADIQITPFEGIGKPEPLKHKWAGYWSRWITSEHRLVYKEKTILFLSLNYVSITNGRQNIVNTRNKI